MQAAHITPADLQSSRWLRCIATPGRFLAVVAGYFTLQILLRLITSNTTGIDESEQLLLTQQLALGYGPQPPLYTWLQFPLVAIFGPTILPLTLLKNLLLFGLYAVTYFNARLVTRNHWLAMTATLSLLFIPQISWECQRDLTHSVLLTFTAATTFYFFIRISRRGLLRDYLGFGFYMALGLLAKYNYAVFLCGLFAAALTLPPLRKALCNKRMLVALLLCAAVVAPHAWWAITHRADVFSTAHKLGIQPDEPWLTATLTGLGSLFGSIVAHVGALLGIFMIVYWKWAKGALASRPQQPRPGSSLSKSEDFTCESDRCDRDGRAPDMDVARLITRAISFVLGLLLVAVLVFKVTSLKDRWLLPVFFWLPALLVVRCAPRLDSVRIKCLTGIAATVALIVCVALPGHVWFFSAKPGRQSLQSPFDELCRQLAESNPHVRLIIAENKWVGGNLKHFLPKHTILSADRVLRPPTTPNDECIVVWNASHDAQPPETLTEYATSIADVDFNEANRRFVDAPMKFQKSGIMRLGIVTGVIAGTQPEDMSGR
jgi:lipopolysaccharide core galacturonosyltransferase RgtB